MGWGGGAVYDGGSFAYLTNRRANGYAEEQPFELGIVAHGPSGAELADRLATEIRRWQRDFRSSTRVHIVVRPITSGEDVDDAYVIEKRHSKVAITFR